MISLITVSFLNGCKPVVLIPINLTCSQVSLYLNESMDMKMYLDESSQDQNNLKWTSNNERLIRITRNGVILPVVEDDYITEGYASITVENKSGNMDSCIVYFNPQYECFELYLFNYESFFEFRFDHIIETENEITQSIIVSPKWMKGIKTYVKAEVTLIFNLYYETNDQPYDIKYTEAKTYQIILTDLDDSHQIQFSIPDIPSDARNILKLIDIEVNMVEGTVYRKLV